MIENIIKDYLVAILLSICWLIGMFLGYKLLKFIVNVSDKQDEWWLEK